MNVATYRLVTTDDLVLLGQLGNPDGADTINGIDVPLEPELKGYAAADAIKVLLQNWTDAQHQTTHINQFNTASILADIEDVILQLCGYRHAATLAFGLETDAPDVAAG